MTECDIFQAGTSVWGKCTICWETRGMFLWGLPRYLMLGAHHFEWSCPRRPNSLPRRNCVRNAQLAPRLCTDALAIAFWRGYIAQGNGSARLGEHWSTGGLTVRGISVSVGACVRSQWKRGMTTRAMSSWERCESLQGAAGCRVRVEQHTHSGAAGANRITSRTGNQKPITIQAPDSRCNTSLPTTRWLPPQILTRESSGAKYTVRRRGF